MLFILFLFSALALAAPLDLPLDLVTFRNLTSTDRCSSSPDWQAYAFLVEDCYTAIQRVYIQEVLGKPEERFEFIARGAQHRTKKPWIRTPVHFTVGSCTLSIIMLDWFGPGGTLPGRGAVGYDQSDIATYRDIYRAARVVEEDCLLPTRRPGWDAVGTKSSIGVFLWATDSSINDYFISGSKPLLHDLPILISPNASTTAVTNNIDSNKRKLIETFEK